MGRVPSGSHGHYWRLVAFSSRTYVIGWRTSYKVHGSRLLFSRACSRITGLGGARRFARKWKLLLPEADGLVRACGGPR